MHGVRCGEMTPFTLTLNEQDVACSVKILNSGNQWTPSEDTQVSVQMYHWTLINIQTSKGAFLIYIHVYLVKQICSKVNIMQEIMRKCKSRISIGMRLQNI